MSREHPNTLTRAAPPAEDKTLWLAGVRADLAAVERERRGQAIADLARDLATQPQAPEWTALFALAEDAGLRHLALALTAWLPRPLDRALVPVLQPLLADKRLPGELRLDTATVLLQTTGTHGPEADATLAAFLTRTGKARAADRVKQLAQRLGVSPALERLQADLEEQIRMRCPRCRVQLRRPAMMEHLWAEHGLILHGRAVREPWGLVEDWVQEYRQAGDADLLKRCRDLAGQLEGEDGLRKVRRLFLAYAVDEEAARRALLEEAGQNHATLCPRCYALAPVPRPFEPRPLERSHGRLSGHGYVVEVSERGLFPALEIATPHGLVYRGHEEDRSLTRRGATVFLAGPPVLVALLAGGVLAALGFTALWPVAVPLALAALIACCIQLYWWGRTPDTERVVDHAWSRLVPTLHVGGVTEEESGFLTGLALSSVGRGTPSTRAEELGRLLREAEQAVRTGQGRLGNLAVLRRLALADAAAGDDVVPLLVEQLRRCFVGELPLAYARELLRADGELPLSATDGPRLRVLLCDAAFESGLEVRDLLLAAQAAPGLGAALGVDRVDLLIQLRLLWSMRPQRPWRRWGDARTVFELAADRRAAGEHLARHPDLLLADLELPWVFVTAGGVALHEHLFDKPPSALEIREESDGGEIVYALLVGDARLRFWNHPGPLKARLEGWLRFSFDEFRSRLVDVRAWQPPAPPRVVDGEEAIVCPDCRAVLWARAGDLGKPVKAE